MKHAASVALLLTALAASSQAQTVKFAAIEAPQPKISATEKQQHSFFDRKNIWLLSAGVAAQTADLVTTRQILNAGGRETDPLARPFTSHGVSGQMVGSYLLGSGSTVLAAYMLHRTGHHKLERWAFLGTMAVESLATASNMRVLANGHIGPAGQHH